MFERLVRGINLVAEWCSILAFATLVTVIGVAIFSRYILNDSIVWAEEFARYLFIWLTFLAGGLGVGRNAHIGVDSLLIRLPVRWRKFVELIVKLAIATFLIVLIVVGAQFSAFGSRIDALLLPISMAHVYLAVPVGAFVMLANVLLLIKSDVGALFRGTAA